MSEEINEIYQKLLAKDYALTLFGDLERIKRTGPGDHQALCPFHTDNNPSFSFSADKPLWHCFGCGKGGDWITYLMAKNGLSFPEARDRLAKEAGVELRGYDKEKWEQERSRTDILGKALAFFQEALWMDGGKETLAYLKNRGYTEDEIKRMGLGHYPGKAETEKFLKSFDAKQIGDVFKYLNWRDDYKVVIPYLDSLGNFKSLWGRLARPIKGDEKEADKYRPHAGDAVKTMPFNMNRAKGHSELIIVEGFFDALAVREKAGLENVIALGDASFSEAKLERVLKHGAKTFTLALDADEAGRNGTDQALKLLHERNLRGYVLTLPDGMDPDEFIKANGPGAFVELSRNPQSGTRWKMGRLVDKYRTAKNDPERDRAKEEIMGLGESLGNPLDLKEYTAGLSSLDISQELIEKWLAGVGEKRTQERVNKNSRMLLEETLGKLKAGGPLDLGALEGRFKDLRLETEKIKARPTETLGEHLKTKHERESKREAGELLGYGLNRLGEIAKKTDGIQPGLYIIGAYTTKGKTALATNLFLDLLLSNPETRGIYFSLDDNRDVIINRFLGILTDIELNRARRKLEDPEEKQKLEEGYEKLISLAGGGRLIIKDISEVNHVDILEIEIRERVGEKLFVVIDGLYNLETGNDYGGIREENVGRANKIKALVDTYKIPLICTGELRKKTAGEDKNKPPSMDDLMETGKLAYNANLVWLLYPKEGKNYEEDPEPVLILEYAKNKLSYFTGEQELAFKKITGAIRERGRVNPFEERKMWKE